MELAKPLSQIINIYFRKGNDKFKGLSLEFYSKNINQFGPRLTHKAITVAVNGSNFGKTIISKYIVVIYDLKNKKLFYLACRKSFVLPSRISPPDVPIKFSLQNLEKVQNSKSKP
jgi:hypothetical protein